jgi:hypothetical protein
LHIPVCRNLFFGSKKPFLAGFLRISFFSCVFRRNISQECVFGWVTGIPVYSNFTGFFRRNSCGQEFMYLLRIPVDSGGFLFPPKAVWLRPATKEGTLLSKIWTKIDIFNLSPKQDLTMVSDAPVLCWRLLA